MKIHKPKSKTETVIKNYNNMNLDNMLSNDQYVTEEMDKNHQKPS